MQNKIYQLISTIPKGYVTTYKAIGDYFNTKAYRKIGSILKNNTSSKIPCHRVILSSKKLGEYNKGSEKKAKILEDEGVQFNKKGHNHSEWKISKQSIISSFEHIPKDHIKKHHNLK